jgi:hypothetical protein
MNRFEKKIWVVALVWAAALACMAVRGEDRSGATVSYRTGSAVKFDTSSRIADENGRWSLSNAQLGALAMIQYGTNGFNDFTVTAHVVVTNVPSDGRYLVVNGQIWTWYSNRTSSATILGTGTNAATTATNLYSALTNQTIAGPVTVGSVSNQVVRFTGFTNQVMTVQAPGWATVALTTNTQAQATAVFARPYSAAPVVMVSGATNDLPFVKTTATNYAGLGAASTNANIRWIAIGPP